MSALPCRSGLWSDRRGLVAVEMALTAPLLVMLLLGTFELTQLIRVRTKVALATQAIQDIVAGQSTATSTSLATAFSAAKLVMTPFPTTSLAVTIASVTFTSSGGAGTVAWQVVEGGTSTSLTTAQACTLAAQMSLGSDSVIVVRATYAYMPVLSYLLGSSYALTQIAYGRPRNVASISGPSTSTGPTGSC